MTAARLTGNTLYRAAPPFLPQIAAGLGVSIGAANVVMALVIARGVAADPPRAVVHERVTWRDLRPGIPTFFAMGLLMTASQMVFVVFGAWLDDAFGFGTLAVGGVAFLLGVA